MTTDQHPEAAEQALRRSGLRITPQRREILRVLLAARDHPTAEAIFGRASGAHPGLSLTTVYRTLETLRENGVIEALPLRDAAPGGGSVRYDPRTDPHLHAICRSCGTVADVEAPAAVPLDLPVPLFGGAPAESGTIVLRGTCVACHAEPSPRADPPR